MNIAQVLTEVREWGTHKDTSVLSDTRMAIILNDFLTNILRENDVWFCWSVQPVTLIGGTREYALPTALSRPTGFYTLDGSGARQDYDPKSYPEFIRWYPSATLNNADNFWIALTGATFLIGPTPATAGTMYIEGYYFPPEAGPTGVPSNLWTERARNLCIYGLLDELTKWGFEENSRGEPFKEMWQRALRAIKMEGHRQLSSAARLTSRRKG